MLIDARTVEITDTLKKLRELFASYDCATDLLDVLVSDKKDAQQIRAFASMSGFKTAFYHTDGYYKVSITGSSCGCYR